MKRRKRKRHALYKSRGEESVVVSQATGQHEKKSNKKAEGNRKNLCILITKLCIENKKRLRLLELIEHSESVLSAKHLNALTLPSVPKKNKYWTTA